MRVLVGIDAGGDAEQLRRIRLMSSVRSPSSSSIGAAQGPAPLLHVFGLHAVAELVGLHEPVVWRERRGDRLGAICDLTLPVATNAHCVRAGAITVRLTRLDFSPSDGRDLPR